MLQRQKRVLGGKGHERGKFGTPLIGHVNNNFVEEKKYRESRVSPNKCASQEVKLKVTRWYASSSCHKNNSRMNERVKGLFKTTDDMKGCSR